MRIRQGTKEDPATFTMGISNSSKTTGIPHHGWAGTEAGGASVKVPQNAAIVVLQVCT